MHPQKGGLSLSGPWWERGWRCQVSRMITKFFTISWHIVWVRRAICINVRHELDCREWLAEDGWSSDQDSWVLVNRENDDGDQRGRTSGNVTKGTNYDAKHHCSRIPHLRTIAHWKQHLYSRKFMEGICQGAALGVLVAGTHAQGYKGCISWVGDTPRLPKTRQRWIANGKPQASGDSDTQEDFRRTGEIDENEGSSVSGRLRRRFTNSDSNSSFISACTMTSDETTVWNEHSWVACMERKVFFKFLNGSRPLNQVDGRFRRMFINVPRVSDVLPRSWKVWEVSDLINSTRAHTWPSFRASYMI